MVLFCRLYVNLHGFGKITTMLFCFAVVEMAPKKVFFLSCAAIWQICVLLLSQIKKMKVMKQVDLKDILVLMVNEMEQAETMAPLAEDTKELGLMKFMLGSVAVVMGLMTAMVCF